MTQVAVRDDLGGEAEEVMSVATFERIAEMEEVERRDALRTLIAVEYGEDATATRRLAADRLHAWATIARRDLEGARRLGRSYDTLFEEQPGAVAMRRATVVQSVVAAEFSDEECTLLLDVAPGMRRQVAARTFDVASKPGEPEGRECGNVSRGEQHGAPTEEQVRPGFRRLFRRK